MPALQLLKQREPDSSIEFLVGSKQIQDLLNSFCPYIDKTYSIDKKFAEYQDLKLKDFADEFIYFHSAWWKAVYLNHRFIKAKKLRVYKKNTKLGARENFALTLFPELITDLEVRPLQVLDYRSLLVPGEGVLINRPHTPYICIVPGVGNLRPHRAYPRELWLDFIKHTLNKTDFNIVLLGGPDEASLSLFFDRAVSSLGQTNRVSNMIGKTSLVELAFWLSNSKQVFSCDTGILHIASALGCKTTSLYSISSEWRTGPFSPLAEVLRSCECRCFAAFGRNFNPGNEIKNCKYEKNGTAECMYRIMLGC